MYLEFQQMILKYSNVGGQHRNNYYNCHICMNWVFQSLCLLTKWTRLQQKKSNKILTSKELYQSLSLTLKIGATLET